MYFLVYLIFLF